MPLIMCIALVLCIAAHQARIQNISIFFHVWLWRNDDHTKTLLMSCEAEGPIAEYDLLHSLFNWKPVGN